MKLAVIGTGYVGLVTGTCFANSGNEVTCVDIDQQKIDALNNGFIPIYEPGLEYLVTRSVENGRLTFTTDAVQAAKAAEMVYLAVGTPPAADGSADLSALWEVAETIAPYLRHEAIVVTKSTVPVGTNAKLYARLKELTGREVHVASNPEFLKEGAAIDDFNKPDRVVVGVRTPAEAEKLKQLYEPFLRTDKPFLVMSPESAELTKYVANALLATKISFINQIANICEMFSADINDVRRGIGHDSRIGFAFLFPGAGYGGSCFPKDIRALIDTFMQADLDPRILEAVDWVNEQQKKVLFTKIENHFKGDLRGITIAIWGLAFKPRTDDIREAPALVLIDRLLELGASIRAHDPEAMSNAKEIYGNKIVFCDRPMETAQDAEALAIVTEWQDYRTPDFDRLKSTMASPTVFDGRNLYDPKKMAEHGFIYYSIGRPTASA